MIICHCKRVTAQHLIESVENGAETLEDLKKATGCCSDCCGCEDAVKEILDSIITPGG